MKQTKVRVQWNMKGTINTTYFLLVLCVQGTLSFEGQEYSWMYALSNQIQHLKPHQITFFINNSDGRYIDEQNYVIKNLTKNISCQTVDLKKLLSGKDNRSLTSSAFLNPRHVTLNIIFDPVDYATAHSTVDILAKLSLHDIRPQCLIISFYKNCTSEKSIESILKYAWAKKFLDFSILAVDWNEHHFNTVPNIFSFNPFDEILINSSLVANVQIFPNKLKDVKKHPMKMLLLDRPPLMSVEKHPNGTIDVQGRNYPYLDFAIKTMNFITTFPVQVKGTSWLPFQRIVNDNLLNEKVNMISVPLPLEIKPAIYCDRTARV